jgi:hypothetical protein
MPFDAHEVPSVLLPRTRVSFPAWQNLSGREYSGFYVNFEHLMFKLINYIFYFIPKMSSPNKRYSVSNGQHENLTKEIT